MKFKQACKKLVTDAQKNKEKVNSYFLETIVREGVTYKIYFSVVRADEGDDEIGNKKE